MRRHHEDLRLYVKYKRRYIIKMWKQFCEVFNTFLVYGLIDKKIV